MKKFSVLVVILISTIFQLQAQVGLGFRLGITSTAVNGNIVSAYSNILPVDYGNNSGFTFGVPVEFTLSDQFSLQPELNFVQKGYAYSGASFSSNNLIELDYTYSYLEIPLLAKLNLGSGDFKFHLMAGPSLGIGMGKIKERIDGEEGDEFTFEEFSVKKTDFGLQGGLGVSYSFGTTALFLDGRYMLGLSEISDNNSESYKNRGINIGLGVMYTFE